MIYCKLIGPSLGRSTKSEKSPRSVAGGGWYPEQPGGFQRLCVVPSWFPRSPTFVVQRTQLEDRVGWSSPAACLASGKELP